MLKVRNSLVAVKLDPIAAERKVGAIVISTHADQFAEGTVVAVGPGSIHSEGGRSETHDLHVGDRVLLKAYEVRPHQMGGVSKQPIFIEYTDPTTGDKVGLFDQSSIAVITSSTYNQSQNDSDRVLHQTTAVAVN